MGGSGFGAGIGPARMVEAARRAAAQEVVRSLMLVV